MDLAFSPESDRLISVDYVGQIQSAPLPDGEEEWIGPPADGPYGHAVAFSPDGASFGAAVGSQVMVFDAKKTSHVPEIIGPGANSTTGLGLFELDGRKGVVVVTVEGEVSHWRQDGTRWERVRKLHSHQGGSLRLVVHAPHLLSSGLEGDVFFGDLDSLTGRVRRGHEGRVASVAASPDGQLVASGGVDGRVRLWHIRDGLTSTRSLGSEVRAIASLQSGERRVVGLQNGRLIRWDDRDATPIPEPGQDSARFAVCTWPDGRIASAYQNGIVEISSPDDSPPRKRSDMSSSPCCACRTRAS
jgi:WD40 repeat protein